MAEEMTEAELFQKNEELKRRQAEYAARKALSTPATIIGTPAVTGNNNLDFKARITGLIGMMQREPMQIDPEVEAAIKRSTENEKERRLRMSGVPDRYILETFETYRPRSDEEARNLAAVRKFTNDSKSMYVGFLVMLGSNGTGKSHLGNACIHERDGMYINVPKLEIEVECSRDFSAAENKMQVLNKYVRSPFLVIDEIGRGNSPVAEKGFLYYILNERYNLKKSTVIITNFNAKDLDSYLGTAIMDRIAEQRVRLDFTGKSYRRGER